MPRSTTPMKSLRIPSLVGSLVLVAGPLFGDTPQSGFDWPQWRGPARDDLSKETGLLKQWPEGGPKKLWSFTNAGGSSTRRIFDAQTGRRLGDVLSREGEYRLGFPEDLKDSIRLNGNWTEEDIDGWNDEMPTTVIDALQRDLDLARAEASRERSRTESVPVQQPAAS